MPCHSQEKLAKENILVRMSQLHTTLTWVPESASHHTFTINHTIVNIFYIKLRSKKPSGNQKFIGRIKNCSKRLKCVKEYKTTALQLPKPPLFLLRVIADTWRTSKYWRFHYQDERMRRKSDSTLRRSKKKARCLEQSANRCGNSRSLTTIGKSLSIFHASCASRLSFD